MSNNKTISTHPSASILRDSDYNAWIDDLSRRYRQSQVRAAVGISAEQLKFYWSLGQDIVNLNAEARWGQGVIKQLSKDLTIKLDRKGFSVTSLGYMKRFYLLFPDAMHNLPPVEGKLLPYTDLPPVGGEMCAPQFCIPWSHHKLIIDKVNGDSQKAFFFVCKTLQNQWGRAMLLNMLNTDLYEVQGTAVTNFKAALPTADADLANDLIKGTYDFSFTQISENFNETQLKNSLIDNIQQFLIELGKGFAFVGKEYRICAGGKEKYIDLLFYIIPLHRYCVVEVKVTEFDFPDVGQLAGYMGMVDAILNTSGDNDCIGLLICQSKNNVFARYSLSKFNAPIGVADYKLGKSGIPQELRQLLPTEEEIQENLSRKR